MLNQNDLENLAKDFLGAWNSQIVENVIRCYTDDVVYRDPNTRGEIRGHEPLGRYLTKLFSKWEMHWELREGHPLVGDGAAILWHASFKKMGRSQMVHANGMDFVGLHGKLISRNEVYFDRTVLLPLSPFPANWMSKFGMFRNPVASVLGR